MNAVIAVALPVFAIIAAGLAAGRWGVMAPGESEVLNKFVFRIAMPAALFGLTAGAPRPGADDLAIAAAYGLGALAAISAGYGLARSLFALTKPQAGAHGLASSLGNAVFLGLPIALSVDGWARPFAGLMLIEGVFVLTVGTALMAPPRVERAVLARMAGAIGAPLRNPIIIGMIAGFLYSVIGLPFSGPFETFFNFFARAAGPVALFSLGLFMASQDLGALRPVAGKIAAVAGVKMALLPAVALSAAFAIGVSDPAYLGALALFSATPTAVAAFVMASQYGVYETEAAAAVSVTLLLSVLTVSVVLIIFA